MIRFIRIATLVSGSEIKAYSGLETEEEILNLLKTSSTIRSIFYEITKVYFNEIKRESRPIAEIIIDNIIENKDYPIPYSTKYTVTMQVGLLDEECYMEVVDYFNINVHVSDLLPDKNPDFILYIDDVYNTTIRTAVWYNKPEGEFNNSHITPEGNFRIDVPHYGYYQLRELDL